MTEYDVLKSIADNLVERKSTAALNNYLVLCNNISYLSRVFEHTIDAIGRICSALNEKLSDDSNVQNEFKNPDEVPYLFRKLIPRILKNDLCICERCYLLTQADDRTGITVKNLHKLSKRFSDYNELMTATRQLVDSLVSDSYQLLLLDAKEFNYHVLTSLNSFNKYVTKSIRYAVIQSPISASLTEFETLSFSQWANSHITQCNHTTFAKKVDFIYRTIAPNTISKFQDDIKNIFKFSSEFTHIGYVSTFFTSDSHGEVIFGDDIGPYLPSTENFSELKYEILFSILKFIAEFYLPVLTQVSDRALVASEAQLVKKDIDELSNYITDELSSRNNEYFIIVCNNIVRSNENIPLKCRCGHTRNWAPPHDTSLLYCDGCGSSFKLLELEGDVGYIIVDGMPYAPIGSTAPPFFSLPTQEQKRILEAFPKS